MQLSANGLGFIKQFEGFRGAAYDDGYGNRTIGYGHVIQPGESFSRISEAEALQLLAQDTAWAENAVNSYVRVPLTQSQFDALVSLAFNWGAGNFAASELLKRLNAGDYAGAAERLGEWPVTSGGVYSSGLARRRQAEKSMFLSGALSDFGSSAIFRQRQAEKSMFLSGAAPTVEAPLTGYSPAPVESEDGIPLVWLALGGLVLIVLVAR